MKPISKTGFRNIIPHIICWTVYICYELFSLVWLFHIKTPLFNYLFFYACNISLFYWHFYNLNRYLNGISSRYVLLASMIAVEIIVISGIKLIADYYSLVNTIPADQLVSSVKQSAGLDLNRTLLYIFASTVIWSAVNFGRFKRNTVEALLRSALSEKANTELRVQFAEAQNAFLKQQINPHLLFNTLNAIYSAVYINSPDDSKMVLLLSDIMRYSYEDPGPQGRVPLENEIRQLQNLIELNTYRFQDTFQLDINIAGDANDFSIIPLVLITLTENMFKHGDLRVPPHSLEIAINPNGQLRYTSRNVPKPRGDYNKDTHVGLSNTRLRLDHAYPDNYALQINESDTLFLLELKINLAYERNHH